MRWPARFATMISMCLTAPPARADVVYEFALTTAFATADPFPNRIDQEISGAATGYVQIANDGPGDYTGQVRIVLNSAYDGVDTFTVDNVVIPAGGSVSLGLPADSSQAGGYNNFDLTPRAGTTGLFSVGPIIFLRGTVSDPRGAAAIQLAAQDLDIKTGVTVTDPNGFGTDAFVLQGGDPFGWYNGDAWELGLPDGHLTLRGVAVPEPAAAGLFSISLGAAMLARLLARPLGSGLYWRVSTVWNAALCRCPFVRSRRRGSPGRQPAST